MNNSRMKLFLLLREKASKIKKNIRGLIKKPKGFISKIIQFLFTLQP